jgi:hypothetical protein
MYWNTLALSTSRDTLPFAMQEYDRLVAFASTVPAMAARMIELRLQLAARLRQFIAEARTRCYTNTDLSEAGQVLRLAAYAPQLQDSQAQSDAAAAVESCVRFEITMSSRFDVNVGDPVHMEVRAHGPVTLVSGWVPSSATGSAPLEVAAYNVTPWGCWACQGTASPGGSLTVSNLRLSGLNTPGAPVLLDAVDINGGSVNESITHICNEPDSEPFTTPETIYNDGYTATVGGSTVSGWTPAGKGTFQRSFTSDDGTIDFEVRHSPVP